MNVPKSFGDSDLEEIARAIDVLCDPESVVELRALRVERGGTVSGCFHPDHREEMAPAAAGLSGRAQGVYFTLNPVDATVLARALNRVRLYAKDTTKYSEIRRRIRLPLDFDPKRPSGISATESEHQAALERALDCRDYLT